MKTSRYKALMQAQTRGWLTLVLVTVIWGTTFAVVKDATAELPASAISLGRFLVAGVLLAPFARASRATWVAGVWLGILMFIGYATQALGLETTSANRSAFITGLNVVMVPLFLGLAAKFGQKGSASIPRNVWIAALMSVGGIALISAEGGAWTVGDNWTVLCAVSYAAYIILAAKYAPRHPVLSLATIQVWTMIACSLVWVGADLQRLGVDGVFNPEASWLPILYLGSVATAGTIVMQTSAQRFVTATQAAVTYALEPVFGALFSWFWIHERIGARGWLGAALVVGATLLAQAAAKRSESKKTQG